MLSASSLGSGRGPIRICAPVNHHSDAIFSAWRRGVLSSGGLCHSTMLCYDSWRPQSGEGFPWPVKDSVEDGHNREQMDVKADVSSGPAPWGALLARESLMRSGDTRMALCCSPDGCLRKDPCLHGICGLCFVDCKKGGSHRLVECPGGCGVCFCSEMCLSQMVKDGLHHSACTMSRSTTDSPLSGCAPLAMRYRSGRVTGARRSTEELQEPLSKVMALLSFPAAAWAWRPTDGALYVLPVSCSELEDAALTRVRLLVSVDGKSTKGCSQGIILREPPFQGGPTLLSRNVRDLSPRQVVPRPDSTRLQLIQLTLWAGFRPNSEILAAGNVPAEWPRLPLLAGIMARRAVRTAVAETPWLRCDDLATLRGDVEEFLCKIVRHFETGHGYLAFRKPTQLSSAVYVELLFHGPAFQQSRRTGKLTVKEGAVVMEGGEAATGDVVAFLSTKAILATEHGSRPGTLFLAEGCTWSKGDRVARDASGTPLRCYGVQGDDTHGKKAFFSSEDDEAIKLMRALLAQTEGRLGAARRLQLCMCAGIWPCLVVRDRVQDGDIVELEAA